MEVVEDIFSIVTYMIEMDYWKEKKGGRGFGWQQI